MTDNEYMLSALSFLSNINMIFKAFKASGSGQSDSEGQLLAADLRAALRS